MKRCALSAACPYRDWIGSTAFHSLENALACARYDNSRTGAKMVRVIVRDGHFLIVPVWMVSRNPVQHVAPSNTKGRHMDKTSEPDNYASARQRFDPVIAVGKRVALAPHTDWWMKGTRYGECIDTDVNERGGTMYLIKFDHRNSAWLGEADLLGALH